MIKNLVKHKEVVKKELGLSESDDEVAATTTRLEPILSPIRSGGSPSSGSESSQSDSESSSSSAESCAAPPPAPAPPAQRPSWGLSNFAPPPAHPPDHSDLSNVLADAKGKPLILYYRMDVEVNKILSQLLYSNMYLNGKGWFGIQPESMQQKWIELAYLKCNVRHALKSIERCLTFVPSRERTKQSPISDLSDSEASSPSPGARRRRSLANRVSTASSDEETTPRATQNRLQESPRLSAGSASQSSGVKRGRPPKPRTSEERPPKKKRGRPPKTRPLSPAPADSEPEPDPPVNQPLQDTKTFIFRKVFTPRKGDEGGGKGGKGGKGKGGKGKGQVTIIEMTPESAADDDDRRHRDRSTERRNEEAIARVSPPQEPETYTRKREAERIANERIQERVPTERSDYRRQDDSRPVERTSADRLPDRIGPDRFMPERVLSESRSTDRLPPDRLSSDRLPERHTDRLQERLSNERLQTDRVPDRLSTDRLQERLSTERLHDRIQERRSTDRIQDKLSIERIQDRLSSDRLQERLSTERRQDRLSVEHRQERLSVERRQDRISTEHRQDRLSTEHRQDRLSTEHRQDRLSAEHRQDRLSIEHRQERLSTDRLHERLSNEFISPDRMSDRSMSRDRISSERKPDEKMLIDRIGGDKLDRLSSDKKISVERVERIAPERAEADVGFLQCPVPNSLCNAAERRGRARVVSVPVSVSLARLRPDLVRTLRAPRRPAPPPATPTHQVTRDASLINDIETEVAATNHERVGAGSGRSPIYYSYFEQLPADAMADDERDHRYYLSEAKRLRLAAEKMEQEPLPRVMLYLESVLCFVLTGRLLELELDTKRAFTIYRETIEYIKSIHSMPQRFRSDARKRGGEPHSTFSKLDILSLRVQSLLYLRMFKMYNGEVREYYKIVQEYQQKPACAESLSPTPSPAGSGSAGSVGSASGTSGTSSGYCSLAHAVPAQAHHALLQLTRYYTFLFVHSS
ncbi:unnamed protein product [Leptidea sinapis]|uniref:AF4/FMR2 family member lilli n=1 Tax=Leptidea sinapis TaxID=189913 RepID=A0A5E4QPS6_9NEOP|nr:unnamed protein product [Leptidea sinapis]